MPTALVIFEERFGTPLPEGWAADLDAAVEAAFRRELLPVDGIEAALGAIGVPTCVASSGSQEKMRFRARSSTV